jgi:hypothetical protein
MNIKLAIRLAACILAALLAFVFGLGLQSVHTGCNGRLGRSVEYALVTGYLSDWSLHEMGLNSGDVADSMGMTPSEAMDAFRSLSTDLKTGKSYSAR